MYSNRLSVNDLATFAVEANWPLTAEEPAVIEWTHEDGAEMRETWTTNDGLTARVRELLGRRVLFYLRSQHGDAEFWYHGDFDVVPNPE